MDSDSLILLGIVPSIVLIIGFSILWWFLRHSLRNNNMQEGDTLYRQLQEIASSNYELKLSNEQLKSDLSEKLNEKLGQSHREMSQSVQDQFKESQKIISQVTEQLHQVKQGQDRVVGFGEQLKNLQDILQNSKQRGALGEYFLETTIKNILPPDNYTFQYSFKDGLIADAVIKLDGDKLLAIDSKFSLENYNNIVQANDDVTKEQYKKQFREDLKLRINETAKYIKPNEGTMDFAFMFIPSEGIYYDLLISEIGVVNSQNFLEYAFREKKVIVVSPSTLYAYLQTIMQGLRALQIEKQATTIIKKVGDLQKHISAYETYHEKMGNSLGTVINHYDASGKQLRMISRDTQKITGGGEVFEPAALDKPKEYSLDE
ncbi:MAG: DNA recombination protein RmuC [Patescibacteria group bacterium]